METTFGTVMGACLGLGLWLNRSRIASLADEAEVQLKPAIEWVLLSIHVPLLLTTEFGSIPVVDFFYDVGLVLGLIPLVAVAGGRWWPFLLAFPVTALPIAGKTIRELAYKADGIGVAQGWLLYGVLPMAIMVGAAVWFGRQLGRELTGREFARRALLLSAWFYFALELCLLRIPVALSEMDRAHAQCLSVHDLCIRIDRGLPLAVPTPATGDAEMMERFDRELFTMLVLMVLLTTAMTEPLLRRWLPKELHPTVGV